MWSGLDNSKEQGYEIHDNVIYQDNQSAIKLEKNGIWWNIKRTRHINIIYYFITNSITKQEEFIEFCTTFDMIGGYFTKALQGSQFCQFFFLILDIREDDIPSYNASGRASIEEKKLNWKKINKNCGLFFFSF